MGKAYFDVSYELLADALWLPVGTEVMLVCGEIIGETRMYIEHPSLPAGNEPVQIEPVFERITQTAVRMKDWGVKPED